jgi:hypothetical protein
MNTYETGMHSNLANGLWVFMILFPHLPLQFNFLFLILKINAGGGAQNNFA